MSDPSELIQKADELRRQAEHEADAMIRERLTRMADRYAHLAESQAWSESHPTSAAAIADVFVKPG
jgi:hypothetical protein